jgi:uncharacterized protein YbbC (DUF1343 family)
MCQMRNPVPLFPFFHVPYPFFSGYHGTVCLTIAIHVPPPPQALPLKTHSVDL